jgi:glyoxylate reductase
MVYKVLVTRKIPGKGLQILEDNNIEYIMHEKNRPMNQAEFESGIKDVDAVITMLCNQVNADVLKMAPRLKVVSNFAVGTDNVDISACSERKVAVTNTPGVLTEATADTTFALILSVARHVVKADKYTREGCFTGWDPLLFVGFELKGKTLGIIGMGRIGQAVARRAVGFGMNIVYYNRNPLPDDLADELEATYLSLDELIQTADILTLHLPYSDKVHHLINKERLKMMKHNAYLINAARGAHIDESALVEHLRSGNIAGAALDVYEHEPQLTPGLAELDNVVLLPHLGSATVEARNAMAELAAGSICEIFSGKIPENILNPQVFD